MCPELESCWSVFKKKQQQSWFYKALFCEMFQTSLQVLIHSHGFILRVMDFGAGGVGWCECLY